MDARSERGRRRGIAKSASRFVDGSEGHAGRVAAVADLLTQVAERGQRPLPGAEILRRNVFTRQFRQQRVHLDGIDRLAADGEQSPCALLLQLSDQSGDARIA